MSNLIDSMGLDLTRGIRDSNPVGAKVLKDIVRSNPTPSKKEFLKILWKEYPKLLDEWVNDGVKRYPDDFYLEIGFSKEKFISDVAYSMTGNDNNTGYKFNPILRRTCPIPFPGRHLYKYIHKERKLEFMWNVPNMVYIKNPHLIPINEHSNLVLKSVERYNNGYYMDVYNNLVLEEGKV